MMIGKMLLMSLPNREKPAIKNRQATLIPENGTLAIRSRKTEMSVTSPALTNAAPTPPISMESVIKTACVVTI